MLLYRAVACISCSVCPSVCLFVRLSVCLSFCPSVCSKTIGNSSMHIVCFCFLTVDLCPILPFVFCWLGLLWLVLCFSLRSSDDSLLFFSSSSASSSILVVVVFVVVVLINLSDGLRLSKSQTLQVDFYSQPVFGCRRYRNLFCSYKFSLTLPHSSCFSLSLSMSVSVCFSRSVSLF